MAVLNLKRNSQAQQNSETREPSKYWINIGYTVQNPETGEDMFISLPFGLPLDSMRKVAGSSQIAEAKNFLLETILQHMKEEMKAGESDVITNLQVQLRVASEPKDTDPSQNPFIKGIF